MLRAKPLKAMRIERATTSPFRLPWRSCMIDLGSVVMIPYCVSSSSDADSTVLFPSRANHESWLIRVLNFNSYAAVCRLESQVKTCERRLGTCMITDVLLADLSSPGRHDPQRQTISRMVSLIRARYGNIVVKWLPTIYDLRSIYEARVMELCELSSHDFTASMSTVNPHTEQYLRLACNYCQPRLVASGIMI